MNWEESKASTALKRDFLRAWFAEEQRFFLTGGSALGLFYHAYRYSYDLDLFTTEAVDGQVLKNQVARIAEVIGANWESVQTSPDFHRFRLARDSDVEVVDLVVDRAPQLDAEKESFSGIRVDTLREIIANKWNAFLGRMEMKDLVDLFYLEKFGHDILASLPDAAEKDGGLEPGMLSLLMNSVCVDELPDFVFEEMDLDEFRKFIDVTRQKLAELELPRDR